MAIKPIVTIPNKVLTTKTDKVTKNDDGVKEIIRDLKNTVLATKDPEGAGLAAPQLGYGKKICVVREFAQKPNKPEEILSEEHILINPKIISRSKDTDIEYEGCLSVPNTYGRVERFKKVKIKALDENMQTLRITAKGYLARVIQHEIDHLEGVLFTDRVIGDTVTEKELKEMEEKMKLGVQEISKV